MSKKLCPICEKEIGFFSAKVFLKDSVVCPSCLENMGCDTSLKNVVRMNEMTFAQVQEEIANRNQNDGEIRCPTCGSTQLNVNKKGFSLGKAAVSGVLLGPVGLLGGLHGSNKIEITCLKCGKQFMAGKGA